MSQLLQGTGVALATPLNKDLSVDFESLKKLIDHTIEGNVDYLVVMGTTGESPVFQWSEKLNILDFIIDYVAKRTPIVLGLGGNYTADLINKSKDLTNKMIDAILSVSPYYSKPSQQGLVRHYSMLADAFPKPVVLYNVPSRTGSNIEASTTLKLAEHDNIIGTKEAAGDLKQSLEIVKNKPEDFILLSGEDSLTFDLIKQGAIGVISVIANILPQQFVSMVNAASDGEWEPAESLNNRLKRAYNLLSAEGNPTSLKAGLEVLGICQATVKPPLFEGSNQLKTDWSQYLNEIKKP